MRSSLKKIVRMAAEGLLIAAMLSPLANAAPIAAKANAINYQPTHASAPLIPAPVGGYGDINNDGEVDALDITGMERVIAGLLVGEEYQRRGDVTGDGKVNALDITQLERFIGRLDATFPVSRLVDLAFSTIAGSDNLTLAIGDSANTTKLGPIYVGGQSWLRSLVSNNGTSVSGNTTIQYYSNNGTLLAQAPIPILNAGASFNVSANFTAPAVSGNMTIIAVIDKPNLIPELNENNNQTQATVMVEPAKITLDDYIALDGLTFDSYNGLIKKVVDRQYFEETGLFLDKERAEGRVTIVIQDAPDLPTGRYIAAGNIVQINRIGMRGNILLALLYKEFFGGHEVWKDVKALNLPPGTMATNSWTEGTSVLRASESAAYARDVYKYIVLLKDTAQNRSLLADIVNHWDNPPGEGAKSAAAEATSDNVSKAELQSDKKYVSRDTARMLYQKVLHLDPSTYNGKDKFTDTIKLEYSAVLASRVSAKSTKNFPTAASIAWP